MHPLRCGIVLPRRRRQPRAAALPRGAVRQRHGPAPLLRAVRPGILLPRGQRQLHGQPLPAGKVQRPRGQFRAEQLHGMRGRLLLPAAGLCAAGKLLPQTVRSRHVLAVAQRVHLHSMPSRKVLAQWRRVLHSLSRGAFQQLEARRLRELSGWPVERRRGRRFGRCLHCLLRGKVLERGRGKESGCLCCMSPRQGPRAEYSWGLQL